MKIWSWLLILAIVMPASSAIGKEEAQSQSPISCLSDDERPFSEVLACYREIQASLPLKYVYEGTSFGSGVERRRYTLELQTGIDVEAPSPQQWRHPIDIFIPARPIHRKALIVVNNGVSPPVQLPIDFDDSDLSALAAKTSTIVVAIGHVPNQPLIFDNDGIERIEDNAVAQSWVKFMESPEQYQFSPLHVPMMGAVLKALDLAEQELQRWQISDFMVTGGSKRAWAAWLATVSDPRISAITPFGLDLLRMPVAMEHILRNYGGQWPLAFTDYVASGAAGRRHTQQFSQLEAIEDPLGYFERGQMKGRKLQIYVVSAANDEFFVADSSRIFFDNLPSPKALRVAPNIGHGNLRDIAPETLAHAIRRWQTSSLPMVETKLESTKMTMSYSEKPVELAVWRATNPHSRDFRLGCGGVFHRQSQPVPSGSHVQITLDTPKAGWEATIVEATFADGIKITSPAYVLPNTYPRSAPPQVAPACVTLPDE